jgi:type I restriction enzyme M protein
VSQAPIRWNRPARKQRRGAINDLISTISFASLSHSPGEGRGGKHLALGILGRVLNYFLKQLAGTEGSKEGEFYAPGYVLKLQIKMLEPRRKRVYDPWSSSSGMSVQAAEFIRAYYKAKAELVALIPACVFPVAAA